MAAEAEGFVVVGVAGDCGGSFVQLCEFGRGYGQWFRWGIGWEHDFGGDIYGCRDCGFEWGAA
jgi:hypothetical protein